MIERTAHTLDDFINLLEEAKELLSVGNETCHPNGEFWYRGHDRGTYTLTPSLYRYQNPEESENRLFDLYAQTVKGDSGHNSRSWETVCEMQHYGIPTRLLDWTKAEWIAVFFAVKESCIKPCIYVLNPLRLNVMSRMDRLPQVPEAADCNFADLFTQVGPKQMKLPLAVVPVNSALNDRLRSQHGRFTMHGVDQDCLELQAPDCVLRISFADELVDRLRSLLRGMKCDALSLFPDHEGIAQFLRSEVDLVPVDYDERTARKIRTRLRGHREKYQREGFGSCNLDTAYIQRPDEANQMASWLRNGPPFLFIIGAAGIGKTNFVLQNLVCSRDFSECLFVFFSLRQYGSLQTDGGTIDEGDLDLVSHISKTMIGEASTEHEREVACKMIAVGEVVLALDGLDELARVKSQEVVESLASQVESLIGNNPKARVIISCRNHIFERLRGIGALGRTTGHRELHIKRFDEATVRNLLSEHLGCDPGKLASIARTPLFYEMIRQAKDFMNRLPTKDVNETLLEKAWFDVMLERNGDSPGTLMVLGEIAGIMLQNRCDLLEAMSIAPGLGALMSRLSKPPFALFVEELRDTYTFSHQALREFVLACCAAEEVKSRIFCLLESSPSFDYEGAEFYARVNDLLDVNIDLIPKLEDILGDWRDRDEVRWNYLARNLFEMIGELIPDDNMSATTVVRVAMKYLSPNYDDHHYVSYKTRYNIARCVERCHYTAPRKPYFHHILHYHWSQQTPNADHLGAYAIRGFHMKTQEPGLLPPTVFTSPLETDVKDMIELEGEVSDALMCAIEGLSAHELPDDAHFFGINCTHALIRWLHIEPDLDRIDKLLRMRHMSSLMKQNIFYALFRRYGINIPDRFRESGLFSGIAPLSWTGEKSWACEDAKRALELLAPMDGKEIWREARVAKF